MPGSSAGGSRIRLGVSEHIRDSAARDPGLMCDLTLVLEPPKDGAPRRSLADRGQRSCPALLTSCIEAAFASLSAPGDLVTPLGLPEIHLALSPGDHARLPKEP